MRVCIELELHKKVRLISLGGSLLGEWYLPTITGLHRDFYATAQQVLELANALCNNEKPSQKHTHPNRLSSFENPFPILISVQRKHINHSEQHLKVLMK